MTDSFEDQAQKKFRAILDVEANWSPYRQMIRNVMVPYATRAFTKEDIEGISRIVDGLPSDGDLTDALQFFVNKRVLRRRKDRRVGKTYFEVIL